MLGSDAMDIILIRHGESEDNATKILSRDFTMLTDKGIKQIESTKDLLKDYEFDKVICSPLKRTVQTMRILGLEGETDDRIREMNWGIFTGLTYEQYSYKYPVESSSWNRDPFNYEIPGGESIIKTYHRVKKFLDEASQNDENILAVTHEGIIRLACTWVIDDPDSFFRFRAGNGSITVITVDEGYKFIRQLNHK
jgi:broad specificity phosphatase PhoE